MTISGMDGKRKNIYAFFLSPIPLLAPWCFVLMFQDDLLSENLLRRSVENLLPISV